MQGITVQGITGQVSTEQESKVQGSTVQSNTVQGTTVQGNTVQESTVQGNTKLDSTVQGNRVQGSMLAVPSAGQANCPPGVPPVEDSSGAGSLLDRKGRGRAPEPTQNNDCQEMSSKDDDDADEDADKLIGNMTITFSS